MDAETLKELLEEARRRISIQDSIIADQKKRIEMLSSQLQLLQSSSRENVDHGDDNNNGDSDDILLRSQSLPSLLLPAGEGESITPIAPPPILRCSTEPVSVDTLALGSAVAPEKEKKTLASQSAKAGRTVTRLRSLTNSAETVPYERMIQSAITPKVVSPEALGLMKHFPSPAEVAPMTPVEMSFDKKQFGDKPLLYIAHDNPQLGGTVTQRLKQQTQGNAATTAGVEVLLESKLESGEMQFVFGVIVHSGEADKCYDSRSEEALHRGSQVLICTDLTATRAKIELFPTRVSGELVELSMEDSLKLDMTDSAKAINFFRGCLSRVDVILDPYHSGSWFPYWEGKRKMAPQFRSKGVGYLRLGDDMSRFGTAFLSLDGGKSFLDEGTDNNVICKKSNLKLAPSGSGTGHVVETIRRVSGRAHSLTSPRSPRGEPLSRQQSISQACEISSLMQLLKGNLKWNERAELLASVGKLRLSNDDLVVVQELLLYVKDALVSENNPNVLKATLTALRCISSCSRTHLCSLSCGSVWKDVLMEVAHQLRTSNKLVGEEANSILTSFHGHSYDISVLTGILGPLLLGPKSKSSKSAANTHRVINWLLAILNAELKEFLECPSQNGCNYGSVDCSSVVSAVLPLLSHREEIVRNATFDFVATTVVLNIFQVVRQTVSASLQLGVENCKQIELESLQKLAETFRQFDKKSVNVHAESASARLALHLHQQSSHRISGEDNQQQHQTPPSEYWSDCISPGLDSIVSTFQKATPRGMEKLTSIVTLKTLSSLQLYKSGVFGLSDRPISQQTRKSTVSSPRAAGVSTQGCSSVQVESKVTGVPHVQSVCAEPSLRTNSDSSADSRGSAFRRRNRLVMLGSGKENHSNSTTPLSRESSTSSVVTLSDALGKSEISPRGREETQKTPRKQEHQHAQLPNSARKLAALVNDELSNEWFGVKMLLRSAPKSTSDWSTICQIVEHTAPRFFDALRQTAIACSIPQGKLLRAVLPFSEETSSSDQANVKSSISDLNSLNLSAPLHALKALREDAISVRNVIRVKLADEADLAQAKQAFEVLQLFCSTTKKVSLERRVDPFDLIECL